MEDNTGFRHVLTFAPMYRLAQRVIGADRVMRVFASEIARCDASSVVVDIGCGTADIRPFLTASRYFGVEPNPSYADAARRRVHPPDHIVNRDVSDGALRRSLPEKADVVMMVGVLHHLNDDTALEALMLASSLICDSGRFVSIDPVLRPEQRRISRALVTRDRGRNVRSSEEMSQLFARQFPTVKLSNRSDLLRLPYDHVLMEARN